MNRSFAPTLLRFWRIALVVAMVACGSDGSSDSVCPTCDPVTGGDSGDFPGTPTPCGFMSAGVKVSTDEASALGFDVTEMQRRLAQRIDSAFFWTPRASESEAWAPPTGFSDQTRIEATNTIGAFTYVRPDPQYCDGTMCTRDGTSVAQATCSRRLHAELTTDFHTLDGAVQGTARGEAVLWIRGSEGEGADPAVVYGQTSADLREVTGSLRLEPNANVGKHQGTLAVSFELSADALQIDLSPSVWFGRPGRGPYYSPLSGTSLMNVSPITGGPKSE